MAVWRLQVNTGGANVADYCLQNHVAALWGWQGTCYGAFIKAILHALEQSEMCVCDLAVLLGVTKSAISHQLKALRLANLVKFRKEAQIVYYSLADDHVKEIIDKGFEHLWQK